MVWSASLCSSTSARFFPGKSNILHKREKERAARQIFGRLKYHFSAWARGWMFLILLSLLSPQNHPPLAIWPVRVMQTTKQNLQSAVMSLLRHKYRTPWSFNRKRIKKKDSLPFPQPGALTAALRSFASWYEFSFSSLKNFSFLLWLLLWSMLCLQVYSWPFIPADPASAGSANRRYKIFSNQNKF